MNADRARLVCATRNLGKLRELRELLPLDRFAVLGLAELAGAPEVEEDGVTFAENATRKAQGIMRWSGLPTLADDSGLEVDALDGAPGVLSARYGGGQRTDDERITLLLANLQGVPPEQRTARFRCVVAFVDPAAPERVTLCEGCCAGRILEERRGSGGFGYDPVFYATALGQTFGEALAVAKHGVSHRGAAMRRLVAELEAWRQRRG